MHKKAKFKRHKSQRKEYTTFDAKIHVKTPGGHGFGMKRGLKNGDEYSNSGVHLAKVFGWEVPDHLKHILEKINGKSKNTI
jgi:coproporphyrinogen III oxidase